VSIDPNCGEVVLTSNAERPSPSTRIAKGWLTTISVLPRNGAKALQNSCNPIWHGKPSTEQDKLQSEATKKLEGHLADLQKELNQAINRVTAEALKRKAAQLGAIRK